jgi:hypothetical protein
MKQSEPSVRATGLLTENTSERIWNVALGHWSSVWRTRISGGKRKHLTLIKTKHGNRFNIEPTLILALTKIRRRTEVLACQKQAQSLH